MMRRPAALLCLIAQLALVATPAAGEPSRAASTTASGEAVIPREAPPQLHTADAPPPVFQKTSHRRRWGLLVSGTGLAVGVGLASWLKSEADDRYDLYRSTADPQRARDYFDSAERYDRATLLGWVIAQASFVGLVYFLVHEEERPLIPARGEPLVRADEDGVEVGVVLWP